MAPEKALFKYSLLHLFLIFAALVADHLDRRVNVDWTPEQTAEFNRRRRSRNLALGIVLGVLVILFFGISIVKMVP